MCGVAKPKKPPKRRVQSLQLDAGVGSFALPVGLGVVLVAVVLPCVDFVGEDLLLIYAAIHTLRREHAEFALGHVEPTAALGRATAFCAAENYGGGAVTSTRRVPPHPPNEANLFKWRRTCASRKGRDSVPRIHRLVL